MAKDINLLPDITLKEEKEGKQQKLLTISSMAILSVGVVALIAVFTVHITVSKLNSDTKEQNARLTKDVLKYAETEIIQRRIKSKLTASNTILKASKDYKTYIEDFQNLTPDGVSIADITIDTKDILAVNGKASSSDTFKQFINNLLRQEGTPRFTDITLSTVTTDKDGTIQFNLSMQVRTGGSQ